VLLHRIKHVFESNSVLTFTYEIEKNKQLQFLDTAVNRADSSFSTSVHIKSTNFGSCLNYRSICPDRYKVGVINTLLHRGYCISENWSIFHIEVERIKQLLTNNNFPMTVIDTTINKFIDSKINKFPNTNVSGTKIQLFYRSQMHSAYKSEEKRLQQIISKSIVPARKEDTINLRIYYKCKKVHNLLITNRPITPRSVPERHHVVYQYNCSQVGCNSNSTYIGYTTCSLADRFRNHSYNGSIRRHLIDHHSVQRVQAVNLLNNVKVLKSCTDIRELYMTEAVLIKELKPNLNAQDEGCDRLLKIFKH